MRRFRIIGLTLLASACAVHGATEEAVSFENDGARLHGTLLLPEGRGPHPAVVLVHGSGELTAAMMLRNAWRLRGSGYAVLAYDKRGVGRSTGEYSTIGPGNSDRMFGLLAGDALAAVDLLCARRDIDRARVGLVGISQGGWIAPLAASRSVRVRFVVSISGPAVSVGEEIAYSRLAGADPGSIQGLGDDEIDRRMRAFAGPHGYDPVPVLRGLNVPSFWVIGERDRSIPVARTLDALRALAASGRPIATHVVPGADHGLRDAEGRAPDVWTPVLDWIARQR
jgi:dipeptidyl aminopeptidase/acylaminoacyl peptidase